MARCARRQPVTSSRQQDDEEAAGGPSALPLPSRSLDSPSAPVSLPSAAAAAALRPAGARVSAGPPSRRERAPVGRQTMQSSAMQSAAGLLPAVARTTRRAASLSVLHARSSSRCVASGSGPEAASPGATPDSHLRASQDVVTLARARCEGCGGGRASGSESGCVQERRDRGSAGAQQFQASRRLGAHVCGAARVACPCCAASAHV